MKKALSVILILILSIALLSCGMKKEKPAESTTEEQKQDSKLKNVFKDITSDTGMHMKSTTETNGITIEMDLYKKGDKMYADTRANGSQFIMIVSGNFIYMLDQASKTAVRAEMTPEQKAQVDNSMSGMDTVYDTAESDEEFTRSTCKIDGMNYDSEVYDSKDGKATFVFNDDGDLVYLITEAGGQEVRMKIDALDGDVTDGIFEVPDGYTVVDQKSQPADSTESTGDKSGQTSQDLQTVISGDGSFRFQTGKDYIINTNGGFVDVYLETRNTIPFFNCYPMMRLNRESTRTFLEGVKEQVKKNHDGRLTGEPEDVTLEINGQKIAGFTYAYTTDNGKDTVHAANYANLIGGTFYSWSCGYMEGEINTDTEAALKTAMETFEVLK